MNKRRCFLHMLRKNFKKKRAKTYPSPEIRAMKGCILKCDLGLLLEHTGIYIGRGRIVGLNRHSEIRIEDPTSFFRPEQIRNPAGFTLPATAIRTKF